MLRHFMLAALATILAMALSVGCKPETALPGGGGGAAPTPTLYGDPDQCGRCVQEQCVAAFTACEAQPECATYVACLFDCPVDAEGGPVTSCAAACPAPTATAAVTAQAELATCTDGELVRYACPTCPGAFPPPAHPCFVHENCAGPQPDDTPCRACLHTKCCGVREAYENNAEAVALATCYVDCYDTAPSVGACLVGCDEAHADGVGDFAAMFTCATYHCYLECNEAEPEYCEGCFIKGCEAEYGELFCSADGQLLQNCIVACNEDLACEMSCYADYPDATQAGQAHAECVAANCGEICGI